MAYTQREADSLMEGIHAVWQAEAVAAKARYRLASYSPLNDLNERTWPGKKGEKQNDQE